nr:Transposon Ty3-I Gag-Pol polyprotein [Cajanus cajan]
MLELAIKFNFKATNNQAEYEALLAGLTLAKDLGVRRLKCCSDSKLITEQVGGTYQTKEPQLQRDDLLSKLASTKRPGQHRTIIQEKIAAPSCQVTAVFANSSYQQGWMADIWKYLKHGILPDNKVEASKVKNKSCNFTIEADELFKRGFSMPLLKCLDTDQAKYVMDEIHRGICGMHSGARSMAVRVIRDGYYWPTMRSDCKAYVQKCEACQKFDKNYEQFLTQLGINHKVTSVEHPQTNGQAEAANKVILRELKKRLGSSKGEWVPELPSVLWAYHYTPQTTTQETPYRLTYGSDAMIPVEVGEPSHRRLTFDESHNEVQLNINLNLIEETRECARVQEEACKLQAAR